MNPTNFPYLTWYVSCPGNRCLDQPRNLCRNTSRFNLCSKAKKRCHQVQPSISRRENKACNTATAHHLSKDTNLRSARITQERAQRQPPSTPPAPPYPSAHRRNEQRTNWSGAPARKSCHPICFPSPPCPSLILPQNANPRHTSPSFSNSP